MKEVTIERMKRREWSEDDPLNGPRCLCSAVIGGVLTVIAALVVWRLL